MVGPALAAIAADFEGGGELLLRVCCVTAFEGFLRGGCFDLLVALVAVRNAAGRTYIAVPLLARVHVPVVNRLRLVLFWLSGRRFIAKAQHPVDPLLALPVLRLIVSRHKHLVALAVVDRPHSANQLINPLIRCVQAQLQGVTLGSGALFLHFQILDFRESWASTTDNMRRFRDAQGFIDRGQAFNCSQKHAGVVRFEHGCDRCLMGSWHWRRCLSYP